MSTTTCPNGHVSADPEWCDTCGARLGTAAVPTPPATAAPSSAPGSAGGSLPCPHCSAPNVADALFCEDCGYDFTTGQTPEPVPTGTVPVTGAGPAGSANGSGAAPAIADVTGGVSALSGPPPPTGWIVIVEIDPEWFALKGTLADRPCPSPSSSTIPLGHLVVRIGRSSQSRGIHPEIAMDSDTAVSRQHAQLVAVSSTGAADGPMDAFAAVDLGSTNGTFVVSAGTEPTAEIEPIAPGVPVPLADGDRVYIGAWSRLTVRTSGA